MAQPARPLRADAVRNRARVLDVAYETFAAEGLSVPIDEIARRAGVGAGTVYRHFPTKEALFAAVIEDRMRHLVDDGYALLKSEGPGEALFSYLRSIVLQWGATDRGLVDALAGLGIDIPSVAPDAEDAFLAVLADLLRAAQAMSIPYPARASTRPRSAAPHCSTIERRKANSASPGPSDSSSAWPSSTRRCMRSSVTAANSASFVGKCR